MTDEEILSWLDTNSRLGIIITDTSLNITKANEWIRHYKKINPELILGKSIFEAFPEIKELGREQYYIDASKGKSFFFDNEEFGYLLVINMSRKTYMRQAVHIMPLIIKKTITGTVTLIEDISGEGKYLIKEKKVTKSN